MSRPDLPNLKGKSGAVVNPLATLHGYLTGLADKLAVGIYKGLSPARMIDIVCAAASRQPELAECTPLSIYRSLKQCAQMGLEPCTPQRHAYLVPFRNNKMGTREAQLIIGYQGLCELALRHERVKGVRGAVVYRGDMCAITLEPPTVHHEWTWTTDRSKENLLGAYAVAELTTGAFAVDVMTMDEIVAIRGRSKAKDSGPWVTDFEAMCRKTVIRRLLQRGSVPMSSELGMAIEEDSDDEVIKPAQVTINEALDSMGVPPFKEEPAEQKVAQEPSIHDLLAEAIQEANISTDVILAEAKKRGKADFPSVANIPDKLARILLDEILGKQDEKVGKQGEHGDA